MSYDVLVAGSGGAGLVAALAAADGGARVLVVEKTALVGGTTAISGGTVWVADNHRMGQVGVEDSRADAERYLRALSGDVLDDELLNALLDRAPEMIRFVEERSGFAFSPLPAAGPTLDYRPHLEGARHGGRALAPPRFPVARLGAWAERLRWAEHPDVFTDKEAFYVEGGYLRRAEDLPPAPLGAEPSLGGGSALMGYLLCACLDHGVTIATQTAVRELVQRDGAVVGAVLAGPDGTRTVDARGVVLATGGYEWNRELLRLHFSRPLIHPATPPDVADGDGLLLGLAAGAQVAGLGDAWWTPTIYFGGEPVPGGGGALSLNSRIERALPHSIMINDRGERFVNESLNYYDVCAAFGTRADGAPNVPAWIVIDRQFRDRDPFPRWPAGDDPAWVTRADTPAALASKIGADSDGFEATVSRFNSFARRGIDEDFGRGASRWDRTSGDSAHFPNPALGTLEVAPFFAVAVHPGALGTKGGLRIDERGRVRGATADGPPIPGLYAAGNVAAGGIPWGYPGPGGTLGAVLTFAYLAGRDLAPDHRS